jgi:hypothetical protein
MEDEMMLFVLLLIAGDIVDLSCCREMTASQSIMMNQEIQLREKGDKMKYIGTIFLIMGTIFLCMPK